MTCCHNDKLELNGAVCVFYGDKDGRIWGLVLWNFAVELKSSCDYLQIPQIDLEQSSLEKCVLNGKKEVMKLEGLKAFFESKAKTLECPSYS